MAGLDKFPPVYVTVSALDAGHLTLPENLFVTEADCNKRATVPSLAFLVKHPANDGSEEVNLVFDLGLKRNLTCYPSKQQEHIANRHPIISRPDCADSLRYGVDWEPGSKGDPLLDPATDVHMVILSHVHWDHVGTPSDFANACFVVGSGTLNLLKHGAGPLYPTEIFNDDELPASRTVELPAVPYATKEEGYDAAPHAPKHTYATSEAVAALSNNVPVDSWAWESLANLSHVLDLFGDGSVFVIDSPGHLYGHVNLLLRVAEHRFIYLGGDCCHDPRILSGQKGIALYDDGRGGMRSVHTHTGVAKKTLDQIGKFAKELSLNKDIEVEFIVAHDKTWREKNKHRFWPGKL
ncbi:n-acyl homoserine lactonase [Fusarium coicis]|nr:n-acyl homoserine lactonase [Fusarium coicis]